MSAAQPFDSTDLRMQLSASRALARRVRREQRASWFPLALFALITFLAIPINRAGHPTGLVCRDYSRPPGGGRICVAHNSATFIYWPITLVVAYVLIAAFYWRRASRVGLASRVRPYVVAGVVIAIGLTAASIWASNNPPGGLYDILGWHVQGSDIYRLVAPACAIGLGLVVLAVVERSVPLLIVTVIYLVTVLAGVDFGWTIAQPTRWGFAPRQIIDGGMLLLASLGFALVQGPKHVEA
jgi:hypothetical protein